MSKEIEIKAEELFDKHSETVLDDIDSLSYYANRSVMLKSDFAKALIELESQQDTIPASKVKGLVDSIKQVIAQESLKLKLAIYLTRC